MKESIQSKTIFISFCEQDRDRVSVLEMKLNNSQYLNGLIVSDRNRNSQSISEKIIEGIQSSQYFIPLLTKESISNQWVNQEIGFAKSLESKIEIIPIVDSEIFNNLNGFITKEIDIQFIYDRQSKTFSDYESIVNGLVTWLEIKNGKVFTLETIFEGLWRNDYIIDNTRGLDLFEINDGHWYDGGIKLFRLNNFSFNDSYSGIQFTKDDINRSRKLHNTLRIENISKLRGYEDNGAQVCYSRIPVTPINEYYRNNLFEGVLPKNQPITIRLKYENDTTEIREGYVVGEIELWVTKYEIRITYYKYVEFTDYDKYLNSGSTEFIYLLPNFLISDFSRNVNMKTNAQQTLK